MCVTVADEEIEDDSTDRLLERIMVVSSKSKACDGFDIRFVLAFAHSKTSQNLSKILNVNSTVVGTVKSQNGVGNLLIRDPSTISEIVDLITAI